MNRRCNNIIDLYKVWLVDKIIASGKYSFLQSDPWYIEANFIYNHLISKWVNHEDIILESESMDTVSNIYFSHKIIESQFDNVDKIYISTADFHLPRAIYICNQIFVKDSNIIYIWAKDITADLNLDYDQKIISLYKDLFDEAKNNWTDIYTLLCKYLPWYNDIDPIYSKEYIIKNFKS